MTATRFGIEPVKVYIFINTAVGHSGVVANRLREMPGVVSADAITGPFDVIATCEASNLVDIGNLVVARIQSVEGVRATKTSLVIRRS